MRSILLKIGLCIVGFLILERFCHQKTHGFQMGKVSSTTSLIPLPCPDAIKESLMQPFTFFQSGGESYVFLSADHQYVLKLFKHHHMREKRWFDLFLPSFYRDQLRKHRKEKRTRFLSSCQIAFSQFRKQTGLVYLHLGKSQDFKERLTLFDPIGIVHKIDLNQLDFVLQKKASPAYQTLSNLASIGEWESAALRIDSWVDLIAARCKAGIKDHDARSRNFGFIGKEAVEIDVGSFSENENLKEEKEIARTLLYETRKLKNWLEKNHPKLLPHFEQKLKKSLELHQKKPSSTIKKNDQIQSKKILRGEHGR